MGEGWSFYQFSRIWSKFVSSLPSVMLLRDGWPRDGVVSCCELLINQRPSRIAIPRRKDGGFIPRPCCDCPVSAGFTMASDVAIIECNSILPIPTTPCKPFSRLAGTSSLPRTGQAAAVAFLGQSLRPPLDLVQAHDGPLGLKPWSVGKLRALTWTWGIPPCCWRTIQPWRSLRPSGQAAGTCTTHDTKGRGNGSFSVLGCSGEIRSAKGYLILWHDGAEILADALTDPIARARACPVDLFEAAGEPAVTLPAAAKVPTYRPSPESRATWRAAAQAVDLERVQRGARNLRLFDSIRFWTYSINKGLDVDAYLRRVRVHALEC